MKPWREVVIPHPDVLEGTFQQSEFAADITAVRKGEATREYQDPIAFFQRTYITEGMETLLMQVAQRLNGTGGEPVIQLQTAFGGGKTHTLLAVYHLTTRNCELSDLAGIPTLLDKAGMMDVPKARVAILDGQAHAPGQPWKHGIRTLWGELAYQLGNKEGFELVKAADANGTSPGKDVLKTLLETYAPCVILIDELVAYIRQFQEGQNLSGGSYDSNLSFIQALTEACKLVPNAVILGSLPESTVEAGGNRGIMALRALEKTFGRVQALWKPVATEEAFEIVRRRLFQTITDEQTRETVCRAYADTYVAEGAKLPGETQETRYFDRLIQAYPIHPEVFDRLYEDWATIDGFQRTRGVLKLMAKVIYRLWEDDNKDTMILPSSLPLYDGGSRNELTYHLSAGWDPVIERDIDGERAETTELENKEPRFGAVQAARRVARTLFLGSAPSSAVQTSNARGLDRSRVLLGCLQPGQPSSVYSDALNRLSDRLHYLNSSGDKAREVTRFWFDTRANLRREMEDRKRRFDDKNEVRGKLAEVLKKMSTGISFFEGKHIFTPHADVPDDSALRLIYLLPENFYSREETRLSTEAILDYVRNHGAKPRYRGNRLVFLAPDYSLLGRLRDCIRVALAWKSIVEDVSEMRLVLDTLQVQQAQKQLQTAEDVLPQIARECYKWLLCPVQNTPTDRKLIVEAFALNTHGTPLGNEIERVCVENELVIITWSPIHLRTRLQELYWKPDKPAIEAMVFWEDTMQYLYLPRLKNRDVFAQVIATGADSRDFFGTAYGHSDGKFDGFKLGDANVQLDDTLLLIEPEAAKQYEAENQTPDPDIDPDPPPGSPPAPAPPPEETPPPEEQTSIHTFIGTANVNPSVAKMRLVQIAEEIISLLQSDPQARVDVRLEIQAKFPNGVPDQIKRAVSENANQLDFTNNTWE